MDCVTLGKKNIYIYTCFLIFVQVNTSKSLERRQASKPARNMRKVAGHLGLHCSKAGPRAGQTLIYSSVLIFHGIKLRSSDQFLKHAVDTDLLGLNFVS